MVVRRTRLELLVARVEQSPSNVRAGVTLVELGLYRSLRQAVEQNTLIAGMVCHAKALLASTWFSLNFTFAQPRAYVLSD